MKTRFIVCPLITNMNEEYLICRMPKNRGAFPNQWGLPGGGIEEGEKIIDALKREVKEELGNEIELFDIKPWIFRDDSRVKLYPDGNSETVYMIYLIFNCKTKKDKIVLNDEFEEYKWVKIKDIFKYDLNEATKITFQQKLNSL